MTEARTASRPLLRWLGWFILVQCVVFSLIALRYLEAGDLAPGFVGKTFGVAMYLGHFISLSTLIFLPLLVLAVCWPKRHIIISCSIAIAIIAVLALVIDTVVYQQYRFHINSAILSLIFSTAADDVFVFSSRMYVLAIVIALGFAVIQILLAWSLWQLLAKDHLRGLGCRIAMVLTLVFLGQNLAYAYFDASGNTPLMRAADLLPLYAPLTAKEFLDEHGFDVAQSSEMPSLDGSSMNYPLAPLKINDKNDNPNILFIVIESWRFDAISPKITPNINNFAEKNIRFKHHYSGGNASRTGLFSLFYGIPGTYWQSAINGDERPALIDVLDKKGYQFFISSSADLETPPFHRVLFRGIDGLRFKPEGDSAVERDTATTKNAIAFLKQEHERPFFGFVFVDAPHAYDYPDTGDAPFQPAWDNVNHMALGPDFDATAFFNRYKNAVHYADSLVGQILQTLDKQGLMDNTVVVITADHGQEFNDTGQNYWGHNGNFSRYQTRVPLVLHWPGHQPQAVDHITSHMDVAPTILHLAHGVQSAYKNTSVGNNLFHSDNRLPLLLSKYSEYAAVTKNRILVFKSYGAIETYTHDYQLIEDAEPDIEVVKHSLKAISQFLKKTDDSDTSVTASQ